MEDPKLLLNISTTTVHPSFAGNSDALSISHVGDGIFLQSKTAKILAGAFVWMALFITCQQVRKTITVLCNSYKHLL